MNLQEREQDGETQIPEGEEPQVVDTPKIRKEISKAFKEMEAIDTDREELNAKANEVRARMKNKGIPTKSFNAAYSRYKLDEEKRQDFDFAFRLCCEAVGVWFQPTLFEGEPTEPEGENLH